MKKATPETRVTAKDIRMAEGRRRARIQYLRLQWRKAELRDRAAAGDTEAADTLAWLARRATGYHNRYIKKHPERKWKPSREQRRLWRRNSYAQGKLYTKKPEAEKLKRGPKPSPHFMVAGDDLPACGRSYRRRVRSTGIPEETRCPDCREQLARVGLLPVDDQPDKPM